MAELLLEEEELDSLSSAKRYPVTMPHPKCDTAVDASVIPKVTIDPATTPFCGLSTMYLSPRLFV